MSTTTQPPKPKRRWCQFSLRTLLLVTTIAIVAFGVWVQYGRQRARENRARMAAIEEAAAEIEKLGTVFYEEVRPQTWLEKQFDDPGDADDPAGGLRVSGVFLDSPFFHGVLDYSTEITDADLEPLKVLTSLKNLSLANSQFTDAGLVHLKGLTKLKELNLSLTYVTESGLKHLKGLMELETLRLGGYGGCGVTDAGLEHLMGLTNLKHLYLYNSEVTDEGVTRFQQALPNCEIVRFVVIE